MARGGRAGLLGNLDFLDAPFSGTAYTSDLILTQQSDSVGDVLQNDPVVRVAKGFGNFQEVYVLRGFPVYSDDITLNGVYGILPSQLVHLVCETSPSIRSDLYLYNRTSMQHPYTKCSRV